jgi:glycine oxidase ThiO
MSHKVSSCEVVIAGGGVIGAACARAAALRGLRVAVCEPGPDPAAASPASAGMLAAQIEPVNDELRAVGIRGRDLYQTLAPALLETTGIDVGLWRAGIASLAFDEGRAAALRDEVANQRQAGLRCDWLEPADIAGHVPGAAPALGALFAPEDGAVDPPALTRALLADAGQRGTSIVPEGVLRVTVVAGRATGVVTTRGTISARHVVVCAGAWSPRIEIAGGRTIPVEPVRGQMAAVPWPDGLPRSILYSDHAYVLARGAEALMGSTMERVGFDARVTESGIAEIRQGAERLLPALAKAAPGRSWAGLRPVTPDGLPIIGPDAGIDGVWYATGHGRSGVLLAALTGEIIGMLLAGETPHVDLAPFAITRFR